MKETIFNQKQAAHASVYHILCFTTLTLGMTKLFPLPKLPYRNSLQTIIENHDYHESEMSLARPVLHQYMPAVRLARQPIPAWPSEAANGAWAQALTCNNHIKTQIHQAARIASGDVVSPRKPLQPPLCSASKRQAIAGLLPESPQSETIFFNHEPTGHCTTQVLLCSKCKICLACCLNFPVCLLTTT